MSHVSHIRRIVLLFGGRLFVRLQDDGRVLIGLSAIPAGAYYQQDAVRFYLTDDKRSSSKKRNAFTSSDSDEEWAELPRHSMA